MEPIKQSLIDAAGNLEASEQNVQARVRANFTKKKLTIKRFLPSFAAVAIVAIIAFALTLLPKDESIITANYSTEEQLAYLYEKMHEGKSTHPHLSKLEFITDVALPSYAKYLGITINQEELALWIETEIEKEKDAETFKLLQQRPEYDKIINIYVPHYYTARYLEKEVLQKYKELYPTLSKMSREHLMQYEAISYFMHEEEVKHFASYEEISSIIDYTDNKGFGTIIATDKNVVTVAIGANYLDIAELSVDQISSFHEVVQLPLPNKTAELGQYVQFYYMNDFVIEKRNVKEIVPVSIVPAYTIFTDPSSMFADNFKQLIGSFNWSAHTKFNRLPNEYYVAIGDVEYLFAYDEQPIKLYNLTMDEVATVPVEKTEEFINTIRKFIPELQ